MKSLVLVGQRRYDHWLLWDKEDKITGNCGKEDEITGHSGTEGMDQLETLK